MDERYHVILVGVSSSASSKQKVIERMAHLFGLSVEVVEQLFGRAPVAVKRSVDRPTADEYQQMIQIAGGTCEIRPARQKSPSAAAPAAAAQPASIPAAPAAATAALAPEDEPLLLSPHPQRDPGVPAEATPLESPTPAPASIPPEPDKGAIVLTIDERVLQRAAVLAAMPEEMAGSDDSGASAASGAPASAGKRCPKCGYVRLGSEVVPDYECPKCGIVYFKYEAYLERQQDLTLPQGGSPSPALRPAGEAAAAGAGTGASHQQPRVKTHPLRRFEAEQLAMSGVWLIIGATALGALSQLLQHYGMEERFVSHGAWGYTSLQPTSTFYFGVCLSLLVALPLAIWGGIRLARSKWRHDAWGLLGAFSLLGLYFLYYRLADHRPPDHQPVGKGAAPPAGSSS